MRKVLVVGVALLGLGGPARSGGPSPPARENWPHWRGPLASGMAPKGNPPVKWDERTNVRWKVPLPGKGSSTPVVWGDQVFVLTAVKTDRKADPKDLPRVDGKFERKTDPPLHYYRFVVLSLDRNTGKVRWQRTAAERVPHEGHHPTHSYAAGSPVTDGKRLYASFGSFGVYCFDLAGKQLWQRDLGRLVTRLGWGEASTPALHGDALVLTRDQEGKSALVCLDAKTGETRWQVERDEPTSWATPLIVEHKGRAQVVVNGTNKVRSYELASGKLLWQCGPLTVNAIPSPVSAGGVVYCMSGYRGSVGYAIPLDARGDLSGTDRVRWKVGKGTPYVPSPLLDGDRLYFTQANLPLLTCLDARTGKVLMDRERLPELDSLYASPAGVAGRLYFVGRDGTTVVLKRADKLEVLAVNRLDEPIDASPVIVGRQLFLRGHGHLYCLEGG
jgi:outer membrane protein assembly factor BamB